MSVFAIFVLNNNYVAMLITKILLTNVNTNCVSIFGCESMSRFRFTLEKDYELFLIERAG